MNSNIFAKANQIIKTCDAAYLGVIDENGCPHVSTVSTIKPEDIFTAYFATDMGNKTRRLLKDKRASVCYRAGGSNITLAGEAEILTDQETKTRCWLDWFINHFPGGVTDPNYCIIKFTAKRASLWIDNESAEFMIDELLTVQSRCGLLCKWCTYRESHGCGCCVETNGNPFHGECPVAKCCQDKGYTHCGECSDIPCGQLRRYSFDDPEHGDKPQGARVELCRRWAAESGARAWGNVLLTDSGWSGSFDGGGADNILRRFWDMLGKPAAQARVLFIPTAANSAESRPAAGKCFAELLSAGILPNNIHVYDLDGTMTLEQAMRYDAVYLTGGDTGHLLRRVRETGFDEIIKKMVYANKVYVGASAGSLIAAPNIGNPYDKETAGLCLINAYLSFHCPEGTAARTDLPLPHIPLTGGQALAVNRSGYELIT